MAGQIARACAVFQVDEVIIFDESGDFEDDTKGEFTGVKKKGNPNQTLGRILRKESNYFNLSLSTAIMNFYLEFELKNISNVLNIFVKISFHTIKI